MCESRKSCLVKSKEKAKPIGAVSPQSNEIINKSAVTAAKVLPAKVPNPYFIRFVSSFSEISLIQSSTESSAFVERKFSLPVIPNINSDSSIPSPSFSSASNAVKAAYVIDELLTTEQVYVNELNSLIEFYMKAFERPTLQSSIPPSLVGQQNVLFGNLVDLYQFHSQQFLKDLLSAKQHPRQIARCFLERRAHFYLYNIYCQNKPRSEALRSEVGECHPFFQVKSMYIFASVNTLLLHEYLTKLLRKYYVFESLRHTLWSVLRSIYFL